jgi:hypothetical protein
MNSCRGKRRIQTEYCTLSQEIPYFFGITIAEVEDPISIAKLKKRFLAKTGKYVFKVETVETVETAAQTLSSQGLFKILLSPLKENATETVETATLSVSTVSIEENCNGDSNVVLKTRQ